MSVERRDIENGELKKGEIGRGGTAVVYVPPFQPLAYSLRCCVFSASFGPGELVSHDVFKN